MNWAEVSIETSTQGIEILTGFLMVHGVNCVMIEDADDFNAFLNDTTIHWDYVDEELMKMQHCTTKIKFYLADNPQGFEILNQIKADLQYLQKDSHFHQRPFSNCSRMGGFPRERRSKNSSPQPGNGLWNWGTPHYPTLPDHVG